MEGGRETPGGREVGGMGAQGPIDAIVLPWSENVIFFILVSPKGQSPYVPMKIIYFITCKSPERENHMFLKCLFVFVF